MKDLIYAIDFGTTNSLVTAATPDGVTPPVPLDPFAKDPTMLRSLLYFPSMKQVFYGAEAVKEFTDRQGVGRLIRSIKRQLPIRSFIGTWIEERPVNLEDIIGFFLAELRKRANAHFGADVDRCVLGRPARFSMDDAEDRFAQFRLGEAAKRAGFKHVEFCPEPVAAAHEFRNRMDEAKIVCVADFGGGTSDYTVMRLSKETFEVLSIGGVTVAGDALDGSVMRHQVTPHFGSKVEYKVPFGSNVMRMPVHLMEKLCSPADISFLSQNDTLDYFRNVRQWVKNPADKECLDRLFCLVQDQLGFYVFEEIEGCKRRLTDSPRSQIKLDYPGIEVEDEISRPTFDSHTSEKVEQILASLDATVKDAGLKFSDIDIVCCTGGTAKVPVIHQGLVARFGADKVRPHDHFHSVAQGLAYRARQLF